METCSAIIATVKHASGPLELSPAGGGSHGTTSSMAGMLLVDRPTTWFTEGHAMKLTRDSIADVTRERLLSEWPRTGSDSAGACVLVRDPV